MQLEHPYKDETNEKERERARESETQRESACDSLGAGTQQEGKLTEKPVVKKIKMKTIELEQSASSTHIN